MTEKIFEENLEKFSKICPKTALILQNIDPSSWQFCLTFLGELNIKKNERQLHFQEGAVREAELFLNPLLKDNIDAIYVYGIGLGYSYFVAKEWLKKNPQRKIIFIEDDLELLHRFLETERASDMLSNPQARLIFVEPSFGIDGAEVLIESSLKQYQIVAFPPYGQNKKEQFQKIVQMIMTRLFMYSNRIRETLSQELLAPNFYQKMAKISEAKSAKGLLEAFTNIPCLIIGAGPSLEKDLALLKELEDRAIFFGAGSAINALNEHGIYTHFGAGLDPTPVQASRIKTNAAFETPFFYTNRFSYEAFDVLHGSKIYTSQQPEKTWCEWFEEELGIDRSYALNTGFSTSNYCTSLAIFLGCSPIIFLGLDMAFSESKYLSGVKAYPGDSDEVAASLKAPNTIAVTNFEGKTFATTVSFVHESGWLTVQAKEHPNTKFIYGSTQGFGVNGVERKALKGIPFTREYDLLNHIHAAIELTPYQISGKEVDAVFKKWEKSLSNCLYTLQNTPEPLLEAELEKEPAFHYLLTHVQAAAELQMMEEIIQARFKGTSVGEDFRMHAYEKMIEVGTLHLKALQSAMQKPKQVPIEKHLKKYVATGTYSLENGVLRIVEPELDIAIQEPFSPPLLPKDSWKESVREAYTSKDKIMEGECIQYFSNGALKAKQYYRKGLLHGPSQFFTPDGKLLAESWFYNGKREGKTVRYFASGSLNAIERWRNGLREGMQEYFYPNGAKKSSIPFASGILQGKVELAYPDGKLQFSSNFNRGKKCGKEEFYYLNGTKISEVEYDENQPVGTALFWYSNGRLAKEIEFNKNGGLYLSEWDEQGKELIKRQFSHTHKLIEEAETLTQSILDLMNGEPKTIL